MEGKEAVSEQAGERRPLRATLSFLEKLLGLRLAHPRPSPPFTLNQCWGPRLALEQHYGSVEVRWKALGSWWNRVEWKGELKFGAARVGLRCLIYPTVHNRRSHKPKRRGTPGHP